MAYAQYQTIKKAGGFGAERKAQKALDTANEYYETYRNEIMCEENRRTRSYNRKAWRVVLNCPPCVIFGSKVYVKKSELDIKAVIY